MVYKYMPTPGEPNTIEMFLWGNHAKLNWFFNESLADHSLYPPTLSTVVPSGTGGGGGLLIHAMSATSDLKDVPQELFPH